MDRIFKLNSKNYRIPKGLWMGFAGISLALLYCYLILDNDYYLQASRRYLNRVIDCFIIKGVEIGINRDVDSTSVTLSPYLYDGIAGVGAVFLRHFLVTEDEEYFDYLKRIINSVNYELTSFPTYMRGMAGIISFLTDCYLYVNNDELQSQAKKIMDQMVKNISMYIVKRDTNRYFLGEQLFKSSLDYTAGLSGILLQIKRYNSPETLFLNPNFYLDDLLPNFYSYY